MKELNEDDKKNLALAIFGLYASQVLTPGTSKQVKERAAYIASELCYKLEIIEQYNFFFNNYRETMLKKQKPTFKI